MADRIFDFDFRRAAAIFKEHLHGIGTRAFGRIDEVTAVTRFFAHHGQFAQLINTRIGGEFIFKILRLEFAVDQSDGDDVLHAMIAVGRVMQRPGLVHDAHQCGLAVDFDACDIGDAVFDQCMQPKCAFH